MIPKSRCNLSAVWGARPEAPAALAQRWLAVVRHLQTLDPALASWYKGVDGRGVPVPLEARTIEAEIAAGFTDTGYRFDVKSDIAGCGPRVFDFNMNAGDSWFNCVTFGTEFFSEPDPALIRYDLFKPALLAVAEIFEAQHACAYPRALSDLWAPAPNNSDFPVAWIAYVGPHLAPLVTPPPSAIVEHRPNGGVLMAATDETFDVADPAHMAVARDIEHAGAPLSATPPWELRG